MRDRVTKKDWHKYESEILRRRNNKESVLSIARHLNIGENFVKVICRGNGVV